MFGWLEVESRKDYIEEERRGVIPAIQTHLTFMSIHTKTYSPTSNRAILCRLLASWCVSSVVERKDYILLSFFWFEQNFHSHTHSQQGACSQALHKVVNSPISIDYEISTAIPISSTNRSEFSKLSSFQSNLGGTIPLVAVETPITTPIID